MTQVRHLTAALVFAAVLTSPAYILASVYDQHRALPLGLGSGYDATQPLKAIPPCVQFSKIDFGDSSKALTEGGFSLSRVSTRQELYERLHVSMQAEAKVGLFSGSASYSFDREATFNSDSLVWVLSITKIYGRQKGITPALTAEAAPSKPDLAFFKQRCGDEYVLEVEHGAVAAAVFTLNNVSQSLRQEISAAVDAGYDGVKGGGSASARYESALREALESSTLNLQFYARGGVDDDTFAKLTVDATDFEKVRTEIASYVKGMTKATSVPFRYFTASYESVDVNLPLPLPINRRDVALMRLYEQFRDLGYFFDRIDDIVRPNSSFRLVLTPDQIDEFGKLRLEYQTAQNNVVEAATACMKDVNACNAVDLSSLRSVPFSKIPPLPEIVLVKRCETKLLAAVGAPTRPGETVGFLRVEGLVGGRGELVEEVGLWSDGEHVERLRLHPVRLAILKPRAAALGAALDAFVGTECKTSDLPADPALTFSVNMDLVRDGTKDVEVRATDLAGRQRRLVIRRKGVLQ